MLPATFQWFGLYTLLCFALQGAAGALLCTRGARCGAPLAVGALFVRRAVRLPATLWERAFRHVALASQWLFLFALYAFLEQRAALRSGGRAGAWPWWFAVLGFASVGIHPYFLPPVMVCALLAAVERGRVAHAWGRAALDFLAAMAAAVLGGVLCGAIGAGGGLSRGGYGEFSMNANALWNPSSRGGYTWSRLLPVLPQQTSQYDGFNYLGLGVLALLAAALVLAAAACLRRPAAVRGWWGRNWPVAAACAFLTAFALSNRVTWGMAGFTLPLPKALLALCGIFRSSGRMFYLVAACMLTWAVYAVRAALQRRPRGALARVRGAGGRAGRAGLGPFGRRRAEARDAAAGRADQRHGCQQPRIRRHRRRPTTHLLAAGEVREDRLRLLAVLAGKQGLATNLDIAVSGQHPGAEASRAETATLLQSGHYDRTAVYVTTDAGVWESWRQIFAGDDSLGYYVADSCYFMVPLVQ